MTSTSFRLVVDGSDKGWISAPRIPIRGEKIEVEDLTYKVVEVRWKIISEGRFAEAYVRADVIHIPSFPDSYSQVRSG